jgi:hypothetical protein
VEKEKDSEPSQLATVDDAHIALGSKRGHSGAKRMIETPPGAQTPFKRRKLYLPLAQTRDIAPLQTSGDAGIKATPEKRSSKRPRHQPYRSGLVDYTKGERMRIFDTPAPTQTSVVDRTQSTATPTHDKQVRPDVPSATTEMVGTADTNAGKDTLPLAQKLQLSPTTPFKITYLVLWREPTSEYEIWHPEGGKFLDKTLNQVILELSKRRLNAKVECVVFRLYLADDYDKQPKWRMRRDDEDGFEVMKKRLRIQISTWLKEKLHRPLLLEMEIEPICEVQDADADKVQDESDDVTF